MRFRSHPARYSLAVWIGLLLEQRSRFEILPNFGVNLRQHLGSSFFVQPFELSVNTSKLGLVVEVNQPPRKQEPSQSDNGCCGLVIVPDELNAN